MRRPCWWWIVEWQSFPGSIDPDPITSLSSSRSINQSINQSINRFLFHSLIPQIVFRLGSVVAGFLFGPNPIQPNPTTLTRHRPQIGCNQCGVHTTDIVAGGMLCVPGLQCHLCWCGAREFCRRRRIATRWMETATPVFGHARQSNTQKDVLGV